MISDRDFFKMLNAIPRDKIVSFERGYGQKWKTRLDIDRVRRLCVVLTSMQPLIRIVRMPNKYIGDEGVELLCDALKQHPVMRIDLQSNGFSKRGCAALANLCISKASTLVSLNIGSGNELDATALAGVVEKCSRLQTMELGYSTRVVESTEALFRAVARHESLLLFGFSNNASAVSQGKLALEALMQSTTLTSICLSSNQIDGTAARAVANGLRKNSKLQTLNLSGNVMSEDIVDAVIEHPTLQSLSLPSSLHVLSSPTSPLIRLIAQNRVLRSIDCYQYTAAAYGVSSPAEEALVEALTQNFVLRSMGGIVTTYFAASTPPSNPYRRMRALLDRNEQLQWQKVHAVILNIYIAMSVELPPYVMLEIIDWLPHYVHVSRRKKVVLLEAVYKSMMIKKKRWQFV